MRSWILLATLFLSLRNLSLPNLKLNLILRQLHKYTCSHVLQAISVADIFRYIHPNTLHYPIPVPEMQFKDSRMLQACSKYFHNCLTSSVIGWLQTTIRGVTESSATCEVGSSFGLFQKPLAPTHLHFPRQWANGVLRQVCANEGKHRKEQPLLQETEGEKHM